MVPIPTVAATAMLRAAMATLVRLRWAVMSRVAIRPSIPKHFAIRGRESCMDKVTTSGVQRVKPMISSSIPL